LDFDSINILSNLRAGRELNNTDEMDVEADLKMALNLEKGGWVAD
jgi:hypothetical protein